jgi:hypothetical protein
MRLAEIRLAVTASLALGMVVGPGSAAWAQEAIGDFYLFERAEASSGEDRSSITTLAEENYVSGAGGLTFRCSETGFEMVLTATYLGRKLTTPVSYAFADEDPSRATWTPRPSGMAAVAPQDVLEEFVSRAVGETTVVVHASDFQLKSHTYTFHLGGLEDALARLPCR